MEKRAKFSIGDLVEHTRQGYRGVVVDIDPLFQASGRYNPQAHKRTFTLRHPWYRILVDGSNQQTYVEEPLLTLSSSDAWIDNPQIKQYLVHQAGRYQANRSLH
jgi:heat shock protein HspQ